MKLSRLINKGLKEKILKVIQAFSKLNQILMLGIFIKIFLTTDLGAQFYN